MNNLEYWKQQTLDKPLFPDIEWSKPEQKSGRGRLGIIGGNKLGFAGIAEAYQTAIATGAGEVRILLPDELKKAIPPVITDVVFSSTNPSGSLAREALEDMRALGEWSTGILMIGDAGRSSETAILYEDFLRKYTGQLTITRDSIDLMKNANSSVVDRPNTLLVVSFAQLQKLFQSIYYPIVLTFNMQLTNLVEALHKFTITYPVSIAVFHAENLFVAHGGEITTTSWDNPMAIWRGQTATKAATYLLWNKDKPLESVSSGIIST